MNDSSSRQLILILFLTVGLLMLLSVIPWSTLTGNTLKDFSLLSDLFSVERPVLSTKPVLTTEIDEALNEEIIQSLDTVVTVEHEIPAEIPAVVQEVEPAPVINGVVAIENYGGGELLPNFRKALTQSSERLVRIAVIGDSFIEGDIFSQDLRTLLRENYGGSHRIFSSA